MEPKLIAQNEWLIAINKPAGLIVHSDGRTQESTLAQWLSEEYPEMQGVGGAWTSPQGEKIALNGLLHRLDRSTSGVVLAATSEEAFASFKAEFKARRVKKTYLAWVYGSMEKKSGSIVAEIIRTSAPPKKWQARECREDYPRAAITNWSVLETRDDATLLEIHPLTGRTHQIRVHLSSINHPIICDHLYAPERKPLLGFTRPALHAAKIEIAMPDGKEAKFEATLPQDFLNAARKD